MGVTKEANGSEAVFWSIERVLGALADRVCSSEELTALHLARIEAWNPKLHAYLTISETALAQAKAIDVLRANSSQPLGPLAGVPISIKDLLDTDDMPTTYGSRHFQSHRPGISANVVQRLRAAGAIILGKTNLHEYAYGTTSENSHYGDSRNPWNRAKITGGSSGGSASSVASGLAMASIGTDTGGSIRIPAALCGIVGLKPTYGRVSKSGVFPLAHSLDHVGPMTRTVRDAALLLDIISGYDANDRDSVLRSYRPIWSPGTARQYTPRPIRVGIPRQFFFDKCHPGILQTVLAALRVMETNLIETVEVDIPYIDEVPALQNVIISAEALDIHAVRLEQSPQLYGDDVRHRLESSREVSGKDYVHAMRVRELFRDAVSDLFDQVDVFLTPTTPLIATDIGQTKAPMGATEIAIRPHLTRYTNPWNFSGLPALSIPCGTTSGLPVGLQVVGAPWTERKILHIAEAMERVFQWTASAPGYV